MGTKPRKSIAERIAPQERLEAESKVRNEFELAQTLLKEKRYKEALRKFRWVFANRGAARLFLWDAEITKLVKHYPPGAKAIRRWRNEKEKLLMAGHVDLELVREWDVLNRCLKEKHRTIEIFQELKANGAEEETLNYILSHIWKTLVRSRRYEEMRSYFRTLVWMVFLKAVDFDSALWFPFNPKNSKIETEQMLEIRRNHIANEGSLTYELALGLGEVEIGKELVLKILSVESSDRTYSNLIRAAIRARAYTNAETLFSEAKEHLSPRKRSNCNKAMKALQKSVTSRKRK